MGGSRTTHLVLARVVAFGAADAEHGRRLGADSVDALEARGRLLAVDLFGTQVLVVGEGAGLPGKRVADGHDGRLVCRMLVGPVAARGIVM